MHGEVETSWYGSSEVYKYLADINLDFDFGSWNNVRFNFAGGILTYIKSSHQKNFQPDRFRGTLQPSAYITRGAKTYVFAIRHQSFHVIDRVSPSVESYEIYRLGYIRQGRTSFGLYAGNYLHRDGVDYDWDFQAEATNACLGSCRYGTFYYDGLVHYVIENGSLPNRSSFFDYGLEGGVQTKYGIRYFLAYRQIHDVNQFNGVTDHQFVVGMKYLW
jgi:hypothetical protein